MVSDALRPYHSSAILDGYRDLFNAEMNTRGIAECQPRSPYKLGRGALRSRIPPRTIPTRNRPPRTATQRDPGAHTGASTDSTTASSGGENALETVAREKFGINGHDQKAAILHNARHSCKLTAFGRSTRSRGWTASPPSQRNKSTGSAPTAPTSKNSLRKPEPSFAAHALDWARAFGVAKNRYDWVIVDEAARATPTNSPSPSRAADEFFWWATIGSSRRCTPHSSLRIRQGPSGLPTKVWSPRATSNDLSNQSTEKTLARCSRRSTGWRHLSVPSSALASTPQR